MAPSPASLELGGVEPWVDEFVIVLEKTVLGVEVARKMAELRHP